MRAYFTRQFGLESKFEIICNCAARGLSQCDVLVVARTCLYARFIATPFVAFGVQYVDVAGEASEPPLRHRLTEYAGKRPVPGRMLNWRN